MCFSQQYDLSITYHYQFRVWKLHITSYLENALITVVWKVLGCKCVTCLKHHEKNKFLIKNFPLCFHWIESLHKGFRCLHLITNKVFFINLCFFMKSLSFQNYNHGFFVIITYTNYIFKILWVVFKIKYKENWSSH